MHNSSRILAGSIGLLLFAQACTKKDADDATVANATTATASAAPSDHTADTRTIMGLDSAWERGLVAKNLDMILPYYTSDAVSYGYGSAPARGSDQIRAEYAEMVKSTVTNPKTLDATVKFSDDGMMAYDHGTYQMTVQPPGGKAEVQTGAYVNVWKKTPEGWKIAVEISTPVPAPKS